MASRPTAPEAFAHLTDLSLDATGTFVLHATDEYFAPKERLVRPGAPEWREDAYTDRGKWMDGWESMRRRAPGDDAVILRLGTPGTVVGALVDTTHFKGNAPQAVTLEVIEAAPGATLETLLALPVTADPADPRVGEGRAWRVALPRTDVRPDHANALALPRESPRATHVRLRIHPDGGVARLRVYGTVRPAPAAFWGAGSVDLASVTLGASIAAASDAFFGPPANLLLPGRGTTMGDGWETARRRTPGSDWCVIRLARRGVLERIELDTHFFKGNAPLATRLEALDAGALDAVALATALAGGAGWEELVGDTPLEPHRAHALEPPLPRALTHLRVHLIPHGGLNRLRAFGHALDGAGDRRALAALQALPDAERRALFLSCCGARAFAERLTAAPPAPTLRAMWESVGAVFAALAPDDWREAFAAHPRLGSSHPAAAQSERSAGWSRGEQSGIAGGDDDALARLQALNERYEARHGFTFIRCASGLSAADAIDSLERRLANDRDTELRNAAREQARITRLRLERWLLAHGAGHD